MRRDAFVLLLAYPQTRGPLNDSRKCLLQDAVARGYVGRNCVHQGGIERVIRRQVKLAKSGPDLSHLFWPGAAALDDGRYKGGEPRFFPSAFIRKFDVNEIETVEGMVLVLDAAVQMRPALLASVALDGSISVNNSELVFVSHHFDLFARHNADNRKSCAFGFPAFRASAQDECGQSSRATAGTSVQLVPVDCHGVDGHSQIIRRSPVHAALAYACIGNLTMPS